MKVNALFIVTFFFIDSAFGTETLKQAKIDRETAETVAKQYSDCAGFYSYFSEHSYKENQPETAAFFHTLENGAKTTAGYILSLQYNLDHPNEPQRKIGSFDLMIDGRIEVTKIRLRALEEQNDIAGVKELADTCKALLDFQEEVITSLRRQAAEKEGQK